MRRTGGLRELKQAQVKQALFEAAMALAQEKGFDATTVDEIAARAGVSRATFFNHFQTKDGVLRYLGERSTEGLARLLDEMGQDKTPLERIHAVLTAWGRLTEANRSQARVVVQYSLQDPNYLSSVSPSREKFWSLVTELVEAGQRLGQIRGDLPARQIALHILSTYQSALVAYLFGNSYASTLLDSAWSLVVGGMLVRIRWLSDIGRGDAAVAGGKGANLGEMLTLGLPVPNGFCITTQAYAEQISAWRLGDLLSPLIDQQRWDAAGSEAANAFSSRPLLEPLAREILEAHHRLGAPAVAVRSSATAEDLAEASFAGQQETALNVGGDGELFEAVRRCWASLWSPRALHYRHELGIDHLGVSMALIVQEMVPADAAGVMFTVDPVTRRPARMLVEAAAGLGEAVVSGAVTGDVYHLDRTGDLRVAEGEPVDPDNPLLPNPQLLRLATLGLQLERHFGCPQDVEFALTQGNLYLLQTRPITTLAERETEPIPPESRLDRWQRLVQPLGRERYPLAPKPLDNLFFAAMIEALTDAACGEGLAASPEDVEALKGQLWRDVYVPFPRLRPTWRLLGSAKYTVRTLDRDWEGWWAEYREQLLEISRPIPLSTLSDADLAARADAVLAVWRPALKARFQLGAGLRADSWLRALVALAVGPRRASQLASDLMTGLRTRTSETNEALWALSRRFRKEPAVVQAVAGGDLDALGTFEAGRDFLDSMSRFLAEYGHREGATWYLSTPTWRQDSSPLRCLLLGLMETESQPKCQDGRYEAARSLVEGRLRRWPWLLGKAPGLPEARRHIKRRKATYRVVNARWQSRMRLAAGGDGLRGIPASAGTVRATARLVRGEQEWARLKPGEVMVCPYTNPAWTPLFTVAAAMVAETGGATSHAAIVAREYGIPAVMSVPRATRRIADGQEVLVDGSTGRVILGALPVAGTVR